jgi:hypothetical protein
MTMTKLNKDNRRDIISVVFRHRYPDRRLHTFSYGKVLREQMAVVDPSYTPVEAPLSDLIFQLHMKQRFGDDIFVHLDRLPKGILSMRSECSIKVDVHSIPTKLRNKCAEIKGLTQDNRIFIKLAFSKPSPIPDGSAPALYNAPIGTYLKKQLKMFDEHLEARENLNQLIDMVQSFNTSKQIEDKWPEVWPLIPDHIKAEMSTALTVVTTEVNKAFGLPPKKK